jgi:bifunctional non-homologous end joining protein LigD
MAPRKLEVYERKRHFDVTPEPPPDGARPRRRGAPSFMVHKHHARRLHYDLRLEMDGVLASWAVPKGPSYDPAVRRLAVETEDHPLAYGAFEGRIPDGEYGAGDSLIWDRGTWETVPPGQAAPMKAKGHIELELRGEKLRGRWHLVRTGGGGAGKASWILFKAKDEVADPSYDVTSQRPESVESGRRVTRGPVSARTLRGPHPAALELLIRVWPPPRRRAARGAQRALAAVSGGRVSMQSEGGMDLAHAHPRVAAGLARLVAGEAVMDGDLARQSDVLFARDLLWLDGEDLRDRPARERRELLESLLAPPPPGVDVGPEVRTAPASRGRRRASRAATPRRSRRPP